MNEKVGRNDDCPCGSKKKDGSPKKYKRCCLDKDKKKSNIRNQITAYKRGELGNPFISGPYSECPQCFSKEGLGFALLTGDNHSYSRQCRYCGHSEEHKFPELNKKVIYLDQFVISNLVKLLDPSNKSHEIVKADPFWRELYEKLERCRRLQVVIFPDSFITRDESIFGSIPFKKLERMYEHFSNGNTFKPHSLVNYEQIEKKFAAWLDNEDYIESYNPQDLVSTDLNEWIGGLKVSVSMPARDWELENLEKEKENMKMKLNELWNEWSTIQEFDFESVVKKEASSFFSSTNQIIKNHIQKSESMYQRLGSGEIIAEKDPSWILSPFAMDHMNNLFNIVIDRGFPRDKIVEKVSEFYSTSENILDCEYIKISSVMYANMAKRASDGQKKRPHSLNDVAFTAAYLPYCDAVFIDKEARKLITILPKNTPNYLRLDKYHKKIFSLENKQDFLVYLDSIIESTSQEILDVLKSMGEESVEPYWEIMVDESISIDDDIEFEL